jgi:hypothetical protein
LLEFGVTRYFPGTEEPQYFQAHCKTCTTVRIRLKNGSAPRELGRLTGEALREYQREWRRRKAEEDPDWYEDCRERWRFLQEKARRRHGTPQRQFRRGGERDRGKGSHADAVDAGAFVEWLERWRSRQDAMRFQQGSGWGFDGIDRPVASLEDLAELAGVSVKALWRARKLGRVSLTVVDKVLIAAGADTYLWELYPEAYEFDDGVAA